MPFLRLVVTSLLAMNVQKYFAKWGALADLGTPVPKKRHEQSDNQEHLACFRL